MTLENVFYTLGIVYMIFGIVLLIAIAVMTYFLYKKITYLTRMIDTKIDQVKQIADNPTESAFKFGAGLVERVFLKRKSKRA